MNGGWRSPWGVKLLTCLVAALLLGLGYELARHELLPQLQEARQRLAEEASRANQLEAENSRLNQRLAQALAQIPSRPGRTAGEADPGQEPPASRIIHRGEAALFLEGRVAITLEDLSPQRDQARIRIKVLGGQEGTALLRPGGDARLRLEGRVFHLLLKRIHTNSAQVSLLPEGEH